MENQNEEVVSDVSSILQPNEMQYISNEMNNIPLTISDNDLNVHCNTSK